MSIRRVVSFHYTLRDPEGRVIDSSAGGAPIVYLEGAGQIIDGLDQRLRAAAGTKTRVEVPAAEAYGEHDPRQVQDVLRELLPVAGDLKEGDRFQVGDDAAAPIVTVVAVKGDTVTLDGNHLLAGVALTFEVEVVSARVATPEELAHGHAHGPDGRCG